MRIVSTAAALLVVATSAWAQGHAGHGSPAEERLGKVTFPVSCSPAVARPLERAVALLHSFWYLEALKGFSAVAAADPNCAMAYWGQAMSVWYQIWSPPRPAALKQGLEAIEKARALGGKTPRERDLIAAAAAFFAEHETRDHRTRAALERGRWSDAAAIDPITSRFPYADAHIVFARAVGAARSGQPARARAGIERLVALRDALTQARKAYWAEQVEIQRRAAAGWAAHAEGRTEEAIPLLRLAAELEDGTEKRSVSPGPILAAREQLGDLLLEAQQAPAALREYEASLQTAPARFRSYYGAARAAEAAGDRDKAATYYGRLVSMAAPASDRAEVKEARAFLSRK